MNYKIENLEKSMVKFIIEVDPENFEEAMQKSYNKNKGKMSLQGFRKGKAPRKMIEKMYGPEVFYEDAASILIPDAYEKAMKESKLDIVSNPEYDIIDLGKNKPFIFSAIVAVKPEVTLGEYKGLRVVKRDVNATEEEINEEIKKVCEQNARFITVESRGIQTGDTVLIDFEGFVNGKAFDGGKGEDQELVIGSNSFVDTFEDQLIGKNTNDEVEVHVTFPENYQSEELKNKPALFKVKIKGITTKELPEVNDEFASEVSEFDTLEEYKNSIRDELTEKKKEEVRREKEETLVGLAAKNADMEIPEQMIKEQTELMMKDIIKQLQQQGMTIDKYLQMIGMDRSMFLEQMKPEALRRIEIRLVLEAIVEAEGIQTSEEDIEDEIEHIAKQYGLDIKKVQEMTGDEERKHIALDKAVEKAVKFIADEAIEIEAEEVADEEEIIETEETETVVETAAE